MNLKKSVMCLTGVRIAAIPLWIVFSASWAYGNINNIFDVSRITIDPTYTSGVIAPFTAACPPYPSCPNGNPTTWTEGFPITNIFGAHIQTAEGTYDTIFSHASPINGDPAHSYQNVFFHMTDLQPVSGNVQLTVTGAQDGPLNRYRSFNYFDLYTYEGDPTNPTNGYKLLFSGNPVTDANGYESLTGNVNLNNAGPYFVYQFGSDTSADGSRIFGVTATATPEPGFYGLLAIGFSSLAFVRHRNKHQNS